LGSTFRFSAVFGQATSHRPRQEHNPESSTTETPEEPARSAGTGRILVAEDDDTNRIVALAQLENLGYQASAVADGAEAVEALRRGDFDLVLMDCQMPVMDGFEATRIIRSSAQADIPIIAVTADAMPADRDRCLRGGFDDYLSKPVDLTQLADVLARWLRLSCGAGTVQIAERPSADQSTTIFDEEDLLGRLMGDRQLAGKVLKGFVADAPSQLDNLRKRLDEEDATGAGSQAHALKGAAATAAASDLAAVARAMERAGTAGQLGQCAQLLPRAVMEFERFKSTLALAGWV